MIPKLAVANERPMVVECVGMPGAGKTFLAERLVQDLANSEQRIDDRASRINAAPRVLRIARKISLILPFIVRRPAWTRKIISFAHASRPHTWTGFARVLFNWLYVLALVEHGTRRNRVVVLDQGIAQAMWSTLYYGRELSIEAASQWIVELAASDGFPTLVVLRVQAPPERVREQLRERERGGSPLDRESEDAWKRAQAVTDRAAAVMAEAARQSPKIRFVEVRNDSTVDTATLQRILSGIADTRLRTG